MHDSWPDLIATAIEKLRLRRKLFHSEADFQHELAWELRSAGCTVRLELPAELGGRIAIDIVGTSPDGQRAAIELKYWKRSLSENVDGEDFLLKTQGAHDICRYDFWADVTRVERLVTEGRAGWGCVIALTNDPAYWKTGGEGTIDAHFHMHDGRTATGPLAWAAHAGAGTKRGRADDLVLGGTHRLAWQDWSTVGKHAFRYAAVSVGAPA